MTNFFSAKKKKKFIYQHQKHFLSPTKTVIFFFFWFRNFSRINIRFFCQDCVLKKKKKKSLLFSIVQGVKNLNFKWGLPYYFCKYFFCSICVSKKTIAVLYLFTSPCYG